MMKKLVLLSALVLLLSPAAARADWLFTPALGSTFGNGGGDFTWGASIAWMGERRYGFEFEYADTPSILGLGNNDVFNNRFDVDLIDDNGRSYMFNGIIGAPFGSKGAGPDGWRPYFSGGVGWVNANVQSDELLFDESTNRFAFDLGGGVFGYFNHYGVRGDIRYYQTAGGDDIDVLGVDIGNDVNYWRATVGFTFRW